MTPRWLVLRKNGEPRLAVDLDGPDPSKVSRFLADTSAAKAAGLRLATRVLKWTTFSSRTLPAALPGARELDHILEFVEPFLARPDRTRPDLAVYFGTPCVFQCVVLWIGAGDGPSESGCYVKIPIAGKRAAECITNEAATLNALSRDARLARYIPQAFRECSLIDERPALLMGDVRGTPVTDWSPHIPDLLRSLAEATGERRPWPESGPAAAISTAANNLKAGGWGETSDVLSRSYELLEKEWNDRCVPLATAHGDFSRWNLRAHPGGLTALDWAWSKSEIFGYDFFNYFAMPLCLRPGGASAAESWHSSDAARALFASVYQDLDVTGGSGFSLLFKTYAASVLAFYSAYEAEYQRSSSRRRPAIAVDELTQLCHRLIS